MAALSPLLIQCCQNSELYENTIFFKLLTNGICDDGFKTQEVRIRISLSHVLCFIGVLFNFKFCQPLRQIQKVGTTVTCESLKFS